MNNTNYFLLRRIHSLLGVIPLGVFLFNHLLTNSTGIVSAEFFEEKVYLIHLLGPVLPLVEAAVIFIPLAIHIALGVYIATTSRIEVGSNLPYGRNWAYAFQRWTGWIALVFIVYHVIHLRFLHDMDAVPFSVELGHMFAGMDALIFIPAYFIGAMAVIFHFSNGLCTFCMTWGITVGPESQRKMAYAATGVGAILTAMLVASIVGFARFGAEIESMDPETYEETVAELRAIHTHGHGGEETPDVDIES